MDEISIGGIMLKVIKPWGLEYCVYRGTTGVGILHLKKGEETSLHYHEKKDTLFIVLEGQVIEVVGDEEKILGVGDQIRIPKKKLHQTKALTNAVLLEYESTGNVLDLVRVKDKYKRGKAYEASVITTVDELVLKL